MSVEFTILSGSKSPFVELARTRQGRLFKKQILRYGSYAHPNVPGEKLEITEDVAKSLKANFDASVCDIVQIPLANADNAHSEDPDRNIGEVIGVEYDDNGIYAVLDVRDEKAADKLGKTLLGASAMMHMNYTDTSTGEKVGPTLLHTCITNRPYITGLDGYEELVAATADSSNEKPVLLSLEAPSMPTLEEIKKILLEEHEIDLDSLMEGDDDDEATDLSALTNSLSQLLKLSVNDNKPDEIAEVVSTAVKSVVDENLELSNRVQQLENDKAEAEVDGYIQTGHILPAQKESMLAVRLSNPDVFKGLIPKEPLVKLSVEEGTDVGESSDEAKKIEDEIARLTSSDHTSMYVGGGK